MTRLLCGIALFFAIVESFPAAPIPVVPSDPTKDREGNPLPKGSTARLGSLCYRGTTTSGLTFSSDGKRLFAVHHVRIPHWDPDSGEKKPVPQNGSLLVWDADTGRSLTTKPFEPAIPPNSIVSTCVAGDRIITFLSERENIRQNEKSSVKVVVVAVSDGKEITHFEFAGELERSWQEDGFGEAGLGGTFLRTTISPDGNYLAVVSTQENAVIVFDLNLGKSLHSIKLAKRPQAGISITPDSKTLFVHEDNKPLVRYELVSGKSLPVFAETELFIHNLAISSDGKRAVTRGYTEEKDPDQPRFRSRKDEDFLVVRDAASGKPTGKLPIGAEIHAFQFVGVDAVLVSHTTSGRFGDRSCIARWNTVTLKREWETVVPRGVSMAPLEVSPNGKQFTLVGSHVIFLCDTTTGKPVIPTATHTGPVQWVAFSSDGKTVTTAGGEELFVWATNGERKQLIELPELSRSRGHIPSGLSGDHLVWVSCSEDGKRTELVGWDREKTQIGWRMPFPGKLPANMFSHDGKRVVVLGWDEKWEDWQASVYDGPKGKLIDDWTVPYMPPKVSGAENLLELGRQFRGDGGGGGRGGGKGAGGGRGGGGGGNPQAEMRLREVAQSIELSERTGPDWCHPITLSGDGNTIFVAGNKVIALDPIAGKKKVRLDLGTLDPTLASEGSLAASVDGARLAVADSTSLRVIDLKSGNQLMKLEGYFLHHRMKFSPDGKRLAVWPNYGTTVWVYDMLPDTKPRFLKGGFSVPTYCAFNHNGASLAVGYEDGTTLIWDLTAK